TQPAWHDVQRIDCVAREKHGHGQELPDAHETLACFYDARDDEREGGKDSRSQHHTAQHCENCQWIKFDRNMHNESDEVYDNRLHDSAESGGDRFAKNQRTAPGGTRQQFMHHAKVALPDYCDAIEDRAEQNALSEYPGRDKCKVAQLPGVDAANLGENLSEHHQPQHWLHRAGDDFGRITDELDQLYFYNRGILADESFHLLFQFVLKTVLIGAALTAMYFGFSAKAAPTSGKIIVIFNAHRRSEERRVGKECRSRWSP